MIYVIEGLTCPLLGRPVLEQLGVVRRVYAVQCGNLSGFWKDKYPSLFTGLGTMPGKYVIPL